MLKLLGGLAIILSGLAIGLLKRDELKRRERELLDLLRFLDHLENEFSCLQSVLPDAVERALSYCETDVHTLLSSVLKQLRSPSGLRASNAWAKALEQTALSITTEDAEVLKDFGAGLDGGDFPSQLKNITFAKRRLNEQLDDARELRKINGKLAVQLGVFGGVTTVLLLL